MQRQRRRAVGYLALVLGLMGVYALLYSWGMTTIEGEPRSFLEALHVVVETFTTVGYGEDAAQWDSTAMTVLSIAMQLSGVALVFLAFPLLAGPWLQRRLEVRAPTSVDAEDHVVICGFSPRDETLVEELRNAEVDHVVVESDRDAAQTLYESGVTVVHGDPETTQALRNTCVSEARAVVIDVDDETNATVALSVREVAPDVETVAFVEDADLADYLRYAGVDEVLSPRVLLGRSLADKVTSVVTSRLSDTVELGEDLEILELPVQADSDLDGATLADAGVRERTGASVVGFWDEGTFVPNPSPELTVDRRSVLLAAGSAEQLERLTKLTRSQGRRHGRERVVLAGDGEVGASVREELASAGVATTVLDRVDGPTVDVVGDATDADALQSAGIEDAGALILALGDDTETIFATLVARQMAEDVEIIARANRRENVSKLYSAGADYVLSLAIVSGRMVASTVLHEDVVSLDSQLEIVRTPAPALAGRTLGGADVRARTGCTVLAVERNGSVVTDLGPDFRIEEGDSLVVAGVDADVNRFYDLAGSRDAQS